MFPAKRSQKQEAREGSVELMQRGANGGWRREALRGRLGAAEVAR